MVASGIILGLTTILFFTLREPVLKQYRMRVVTDDVPDNETVQTGSTELAENASKWDEFRVLAKHCWRTIQSDVKYPVCFFGAMITRLIQVLLSVYMLLWVTSFVDSGVLADMDEAKSVFSTLIVCSFTGTMLCLPVIGYYSDFAPSHIFIPVAFALRALLFFGVMFLERPDSFYAKLASSFIGITTIMETLSVETLFLRTLPKDVRGAMLGCFAFFGQIGSLIFTQLGGHIYDKVGPNSPFAVIAIVDISFAVLAGIIGCCGHLRLV